MSLADFDGQGPPGLDVQRYYVHGKQVLSMSGECDLSTVTILRAALADAVAMSSIPLVVDMAAVRFCDALCAGYLLDMGREHHLTLAGATSPAVSLVFDVLDPTEDLPRFATVDDAVVSV